MKKYIIIISSDDTLNFFDVIDCNNRNVVHHHSSSYCWEDYEIEHEIDIVKKSVGLGDYKIIYI